MVTFDTALVAIGLHLGYAHAPGEHEVARRLTELLIAPMYFFQCD